jgi:hypothetical protein
MALSVCLWRRSSIAGGRQRPITSVPGLRRVSRSWHCRSWVARFGRPSGCPDAVLRGTRSTRWWRATSRSVLQTHQTHTCSQARTADSRSGFRFRAALAPGRRRRPLLRFSAPVQSAHTRNPVGVKRLTSCTCALRMSWLTGGDPVSRERTLAASFTNLVE